METSSIISSQLILLILLYQLYRDMCSCFYSAVKLVNHLLVFFMWPSHEQIHCAILYTVTQNFMNLYDFIRDILSIWLSSSYHVAMMPAVSHQWNYPKYWEMSSIFNFISLKKTKLSNKFLISSIVCNLQDSYMIQLCISYLTSSSLIPSLYIQFYRNGRITSFLDLLNFLQQYLLSITMFKWQMVHS